MNFQELFDHMSEQHGLTLTESEMKDILFICRGILDTTTCCNCDEVVKMISIGCYCPNCYENQ